MPCFGWSPNWTSRVSVTTNVLSGAMSIETSNRPISMAEASSPRPRAAARRRHATRSPSPGVMFRSSFGLALELDPYRLACFLFGFEEIPRLEPDRTGNQIGGGDPFPGVGGADAPREEGG